MKKITLLASIMLLSACAEQMLEAPVNLPADNQILMGYKEEFYKLSENYIPPSQGVREISVPSSFGDLGFKSGASLVIGKCVIYSYSDGSKKQEIIVDDYFWEYTEVQNKGKINGENKREAARRSLIYHEMSHCTLSRINHNCATAEHRPLSIMNTSLISAENYLAYQNSYLDELFINSPLYSGDKSSVPSPAACQGETNALFSPIKFDTNEALPYRVSEFYTKCVKSEKLNGENGLSCWHEQKVFHKSSLLERIGAPPNWP